MKHIICVGAQRSATTWLYNNLSRLDVVSVPERKEIDYFRDFGNYHKGPSWYLDQIHPVQGKYTLDFTPEYSIDPVALSRISCDYPDSLIIFIVRKPEDRIVSAYKKIVYDGFENLSFSDFVKYEHDSCIKRSLYLPTIEILKKAGLNYLVLDHASIERDPSASWQRICGFLGLKFTPPLAGRHNSSKDTAGAFRVVFRFVSRFFEGFPSGRRLKLFLINKRLVQSIYSKYITDSGQFEIDPETTAKLRRLFSDDYQRCLDGYESKV